MTPTRAPERGSALVLVLLFVLAVVVLGTSLLSVSTADRRIAENDADSIRAFGLAQAGVEDARAVVPATNLDTLLAGGGTLLANQALGGGTYTVVLSNNVGPRFPTALAAADAGGATNDTDGIVLVTSTGWFEDARRTVEVLFAVPQSVFQYAFWANTKITISSSGITDAYDSSAGPYNPGTATDDGDIFCNGTITLSGSSMVQGDATTAGGTAADPTHVTGSSTASAPSQSIAAVACPVGAYTPAAQVPAGPGVTYDAATGVLSVSGGNNVTLTAPPTTFYFYKVTLSGGSTMTVNTGGSHVDMYIADKFTASGGGIVNTGTKPPELTLYACGAGTSDWTLSGGSGAYMAVHAPTRKVTISGSGDLWGAILGKEITSSGGSKMHYDQALAGGAGVAMVQRSWREVFF